MRAALQLLAISCLLGWMAAQTIPPPQEALPPLPSRPPKRVNDPVTWEVKVRNVPRLLDVPSSTREVLLTRGSYTFSCLIPNNTVDDSGENTPDGVLNLRAHHAHNSNLDDIHARVSSMDDNCMTRHEGGWWSYEFCPHKHVKQFHIDTDPKETVHNFLGRWDGDDHPHGRIRARGAPVQSGWQFEPSEDDGLEDPMEPPALGSKRVKYTWSEVYTDGTPCEPPLNMNPRIITVQYECDTGGHFALGPIEEPATCKYLVRVRSKALCDHPVFSTKKDRVEEIECVPVKARAAAGQRSVGKTARKGGVAAGEGDAIPPPIADPPLQPTIREDGMEEEEEVVDVVAAVDAALKKAQAAAGGGGGAASAASAAAAAAAGKEDKSRNRPVADSQAKMAAESARSAKVEDEEDEEEVDEWSDGEEMANDVTEELLETLQAWTTTLETVTGLVADIETEELEKLTDEEFMDLLRAKAAEHPDRVELEARLEEVTKLQEKFEALQKDLAAQLEAEGVDLDDLEGFEFPEMDNDMVDLLEEWMQRVEKLSSLTLDMDAQELEHMTDEELMDALWAKAATHPDREALEAELTQLKMLQSAFANVDFGEWLEDDAMDMINDLPEDLDDLNLIEWMQDHPEMPIVLMDEDTGTMKTVKFGDLEGDELTAVLDEIQAMADLGLEKTLLSVNGKPVVDEESQKALEEEAAAKPAKAKSRSRSKI